MSRATCRSNLCPKLSALSTTVAWQYFFASRIQSASFSALPLRGPVALIAPCPKVNLGSVCQKYLPRGFEVGTGLVERGSGAALVFARMRPGIETAMPLPRILIMGIAGTNRDRAGVDIAIVNWASTPRGFRSIGGG